MSSTASDQDVKGHYAALHAGDPAPWFRQHCIGAEGLFSFDMAAGRHIALCFYGAASSAGAVLAEVAGHRALFDGRHRSFFGISNDPADAADPALSPAAGVRHFADFDCSVARAYGVAPTGEGALRRGWYILDPRLRVLAAFPLDQPGTAAAWNFIAALSEMQPTAQAPVLLIPAVFESDFCRRLIDLHQASPAQDSAILTEGAVVSDHGFKRRTDCRILDATLAAQAQTRIFRRVVPELRHAFQFHASRLERLIVACYDAADAGRFGAHRDNTLAATAHRRFAVSINLNQDFAGGGITFPEYSARIFRPQPGEALVFSCSLMHAVLPMTQGRRYACLPFVYDDAAAAQRRDAAAAQRRAAAP